MMILLRSNNSLSHSCPDPGGGGGGGKKISCGGEEGWTPQSTTRKNWIIFLKKEITQ